MFTAKMFNPSNGNFNVVLDGKSYLVSTDHPNYESLLSAYKADDSEFFLNNFNIATKIAKSLEASNVDCSGVTVTQDGVFYEGEPVDQFICDHILEMVRQGFDIQPMVKFLENLYQNPDKNSVDQLYKFLQHKNMPITEDGCFIGYKTVRSDYKDKYTATIDNSVGQVVKFRRNSISSNPNNHCDQGLHVGALSYAGPGGWYNSSQDKVVLVKVNPRDAVSVPNDHNFTKLRVCEYEVIGDYVSPLESAVFTNSSSDYEVNNYYDHYNEEDEEDEDYDSVEDITFDKVYELQKSRKISSTGPDEDSIQEGQKLYIVFSFGANDGVYFVDSVIHDVVTIENESGEFQEVSLSNIEEMYYAY
jgi:hypothetical protein